MANLETNEDTTNDAFDAIAKQSEAETKLAEPFEICTDESGSGFLSKSLLTGNIELAVELCLEQNRMADAIILALQGNCILLKVTFFYKIVFLQKLQNKIMHSKLLNGLIWTF